MAELTIRLQRDPTTGKQNIIVSLRSDEDALPHEHEQQHRALVDKLLEGGILKASEVGKIIVERGEEEKKPALPAGSEPQGQRRAQEQGN